MIIKGQGSTGWCWEVTIAGIPNSFCVMIFDISVPEGYVLHGSLGEHKSTEAFKMYVTDLGYS